MNKTPESPRIVIIAGPNGTGKTTFAREFLPKETGFPDFINADLIAQGLSPLQNPSCSCGQAFGEFLHVLADTHAVRSGEFLKCRQSGPAGLTRCGPPGEA